MSSFAAYLRLDSADGPGLHKTVVHQLETAIAVGLLNRGERLPPESELAAELGISVGTLRQALESLRQRGSIETRRGRGGGSFVRGATAESHQDALSRLRLRSSDELRDLGDACAAFVGGAARLAAQRAAPEDLERLRWFAEHFHAAESSDDRRRADSRFHIEVGVVAHSVRLTQAVVQAYGEFASLYWTVDADGGHHRQAEAAQTALITAIGASEPDTALSVAVEHVEHRVQRLIDLYLDQMMQASRK